jgi:hypothetical protein
MHGSFLCKPHATGLLDSKHVSTPPTAIVGTFEEILEDKPMGIIDNHESDDEPSFVSNHKLIFQGNIFFN